MVMLKLLELLGIPGRWHSGMLLEDDRVVVPDS